MNEPVLARLEHLMAVREEVEGLTAAGPWFPAADWVDADTSVTLYVDLPGVLADSLALEEDGPTLIVSGERSIQEARVHAERPTGRFVRTLSFPVEVVPNSGEATLTSGVLQVRFEKRHPTIDVNARRIDSDI